MPIEEPASDEPVAPETSEIDDTAADATEAEVQQESRYTITAVVAAGVAAVVGAALWAAVATVGNLEIGWAAWGVGVLIGFTALKAGGRGPAMAVACAVMALLSIYAGKMASARLTIDNYLDEMFHQGLYEEWCTDSEDVLVLPENPTDEQLKEYMIAHSFWDDTDSETPEDVKVEIFRISVLPKIQAFGRDTPPFEEWRDQRKDEFWEFNPLTTIVQDSLDFIDIIFAVLGISTAYGVVARGYRRRPGKPA